MAIRLYFIRKIFYQEHQDCPHILDINDPSKQGRRTHVCLDVLYDHNHYLIPLREHLFNPLRPYGRIGHAVPSPKYPNAGLDYRNTLVIQDRKYLYVQKPVVISRVQFSRIVKDFAKIRDEFIMYLDGFKKEYKRGHIMLSPLYKDSSLLYFLDELKLNKIKQ